MPLLGLLNEMNTYIGNFGWSIIVADLPHRPCHLPASPQERDVMKKMQALKPQIDAKSRPATAS